MKRKQLNLTERELQVVIDAMKNDWWHEYDPAVETTVRPQYDLLKRFEDGYEQLAKEASWMALPNNGSTIFNN